MLGNPRLLVLLAAGSLTTMAGGVVAPVLPEIIQQLRLDPAWAGLLVSIHCLTIALFSPLLGILADRVGRLRVLVPSLLCYGIVGTAAGLMDSLMPLLVMRGLLGAASGGIAAASLGLLGGMYDAEARSQALGYATSTLTITGILFPLLGGWVGATHWQYAFCLYGLGLPLAGLAASILKEERQIKAKRLARDSGNKLVTVLSNRHTLRLLLALSMSSIATTAVIIYAPLYLKQTIGAGTAINGIVLASRAIGAAVVSAFAVKWLSKNLGNTQTIALGFGLMALTLSTIPVLHQLSWILATAVFFGCGFGVVVPSLYNALASLAPSDLKSSVLAAGTGTGFLGQFLAPVFLGPLIPLIGLEGTFYAAAIVALSAALLLFMPTPSYQARS
ncbi:MFS transporter [Lyngbya aestuarii]|uniref:MFS transporter n=1 Tax=Lyngbya aestuarii TaxID=118322 RepID=UPI00403D738E